MKIGQRCKQPLYIEWERQSVFVSVCVTVSDKQKRNLKNNIFHLLMLKPVFHLVSFYNQNEPCGQFPRHRCGNSCNYCKFSLHYGTCVKFAALVLVINGFAFLIISNNSVIRKSFGQLCLNQTISHITVGLIFLCWVAPLTFTWALLTLKLDIFRQEYRLSASFANKLFGQLFVFSWQVFIFSHVGISIDRLITIRFSFQVIS